MKLENKNVTNPSTDIVVISNWMKFQFWVNFPKKLSQCGIDQ